MALLKDLNPSQLEAVKTTDGPILVLAGAGSGKTKVLTHRIAYLISRRRVKPWQILAMTFTKKAAGEMKSRVATLARRVCEGVWIGTFHSTFARILRKEGRRLGYNGNFVIYDEEDQLGLIKSIMSDLKLSSHPFSAEAIGSRIRRAKNAFLSPDQYSQQVQGPFEEIVSRVYKEYQRRLRQNNAMDFDDLIVVPVELFQTHPQVLSYYQDRFQYILVDEYQDTNRAQYMLVKLLAASHRNLFVVGDDDQSIYQWRGADLRNILDFEKDYPDCKVFRLERNYRSTQNILAAANSVVKHNQFRKPKELWTQNEPGEKITLIEAGDEKEEASKIVEKIQREISKNKRSFKDFAVLYRTNAQSRVLEEAFRRSKISYVIVGGVRFYERKEIKDLLAYLRVISNPKDSVSLKRIINFPLRGIGDKSVVKLEDWATANNLPLFEALGRVEEIEDISKSIKSNILRFHSMMSKYIALKDKLCLKELVGVLVDEIGILSMYKEEDVDRYRNVQEFLATVSDFSRSRENPTLDAFLEEVALITDVDTWNDKATAVTLMTLHSAKGLEFPVVFIAGVEEGLFPLARRRYNREELEEERRLFYVGMTRAKEKLYISWALSRQRIDEAYKGGRSIFIGEIPPDYVMIERDIPTRRRARVKGKSRREPKIPSLCVGCWVEHPHFGRGEVLEIDGQGGGTKATVRFDGAGVKRLIVKYAHLKILGGIE